MISISCLTAARIILDQGFPMTVKFTRNKEKKNPTKSELNATVVAPKKSGLTGPMPEQESGKTITIMIL